LLSYRYEFRGAEVFSHRIRYLTIHPNDPEIGGVRAVPFRGSVATWSDDVNVSIYGIRDMPLFSVSKIGVMFKYLITPMF
jgi:hypothetical protein